MYINKKYINSRVTPVVLSLITLTQNIIKMIA